MEPCCCCCPPPPLPSCCAPECPPTSPQTPQTQKLVMRPGCPEKNSNPFTFQMGGEADAANNICVVPPTCTTKNGTKVTEISDPNRELFVLRIGKKSDGCSKRNNVDLELSTPRPIYVPPPPEVENRKSQYDPADFGGKADGNKKGKGGDKKEKDGDKKKKKKK